MKRLLLMTYIYILYVVAAPFLMLMGIVTVGIMAVNNLRDFDKLYFKEVMKDCVVAITDGCKQGHKINMITIENKCNKPRG